MAKITYVGPHDGVYVPLPTGGELTVLRGETANLPDSLCEALLEQPSNWQRPEMATPKAKASASGGPAATSEGDED